MMSIKLFSTGGTIAKRYDELTGELVMDTQHIESMLKQGRCNRELLSITSLMLKDSLDMNSLDREEIKKACNETKVHQIIITHGTDTMVESAKMLSSITDKTIILTGAMIPYAFKFSDALFNLASAITAVQTLPYGIYIAMNGKIFSWDNVDKNKREGIFEERI